MSSIVVPVNFTANAANAARYATDMALATGMDIHLVNVLELPKGPKKELPAGIHEELLNSCHELLQKLAEELIDRSTGEVHIATDVETGEIRQRLTNFCKSVQPFAIVCGSPERSLDNVLKGSSTINKLRGLLYPLLIVPERSSFRHIRNILIACDQEDVHNGIINARPLLQTLNQAFTPNYIALHVLVDGQASVEKIRTEFESWKESLGMSAAAISFVRQPDVAKGISEYLRSHTVDLLLVLPKKHNWLEGHKSRSKEIIEDCGAVPIMSVNRVK